MTPISPGIALSNNTSTTASQQENQSEVGFEDLIKIDLPDKGTQTPPDQLKNETISGNDVTEADTPLIEEAEKEAGMKAPQANSAEKSFKNSNGEISQEGSVEFLPLQSAGKIDNTDRSIPSNTQERYNTEPKNVNKPNPHPGLGVEGAITPINSVEAQPEKMVTNDSSHSPEVPIMIATSSLSVMAEIDNTSETEELPLQKITKTEVTPRLKTDTPFETRSSINLHGAQASMDALPLQVKARSAELSSSEDITNSSRAQRVEDAASEGSLPLQVKARSAELSSSEDITNSSRAQRVEDAASEGSLPLQVKARSAELSSSEDITNSSRAQRVGGASSEDNPPLQPIIVDRAGKQNPVLDKNSPQIEISTTSQPTKQASTPTSAAAEAANIRPTDISAEAFRPAVETQPIQTDQVSPRSVPKSPIVHNVMAHIQSAKVEPGTITVRLRPDGLGIVELQITQDQDGTMEVSLRAKNPMVLDALRLERHAISDILTQQGVQLKQEGINFDHFGNQGGKAGSNATRDENSSQITGDESDQRDQDGVDDEKFVNQDADLQSETNILI
jgi:hypothetical protein